MSYQQIQSLLETLKQKPSFSSVKKMTKYFSQYTDLEQNLPPENLMVFSIFQLPGLWTSLLKLKESEPLYDEPSLGITLYLKLYLNTLTKLLDQSSDEQVQHIVLQGMIKSAHLTIPYRKIYRVWVKKVIDLWATGSLSLKIRAFSLLSLYLGFFEEEDQTWVLRRCYLHFFENCKQVTWRSFESINLMVNTFCELCRISPEVAYFVAFGNLRLILMEIDKTNKQSKKKRKELIKKLYSFQILNSLKLLSSIITRVDHQSVSPLIYPLIQTLQVYSKLDLSTQYLPLRLHILGFLQEISERTGTFIPYLLQLSTRELKSNEFSKFKPKSTEKNASDLALIYQISPSAHKSTQFWSDAFIYITKKIYHTAHICLRFSAAPEILGQFYKIIGKHYKEIKFSGYKIQLKNIMRNIKSDMEKLIQKRYKKQKLPSEYPFTKLGKMQLETVKEHEKNLKQDLTLLKQKLAAEFNETIEREDGEYEEEDRKEGDGGEENYEGGQGEGEEYQEDNSGASEYEPSQKEPSEDVDEGREDISYEGDPENIDELLKEWSEHEWSSQGEVQ